MIEAIMRKAHIENWILITNDKEFGEKVYRERHPHRGLILLRLSDERAFMKIRILRHLLEGHRDQLSGQYIVVTETKLRVVKFEPYVFYSLSPASPA